MNKFTTHTGLAAPLDRTNVDTDAIIPKQFLKRIERTGFGEFLFFDWRYEADGKTSNPQFELNAPQYQGATVLIANKNFGCGSSREHAPWALNQYGFHAIIAPSYADIFFNNMFKNGMLPVILTQEQVDTLLEKAKAPGYKLTIDLPSQTVSDDSGFKASFEVDPFRKHCLLNGLDDIGLTLQHEPDITAFEGKRPAWRSGVGAEA
jgi:3-isopropylmalate/(R)-2-methylmalate dehydratase small subunit